MDEDTNLNEHDKFGINTDKIFFIEEQFWDHPENSHLKRYSLRIAGKLESLIQQLLLDYCEPTVEYSPEKEPYLLGNFEIFQKKLANGIPFKLDYFMVAYNKRIEEYERPVIHYRGKFHYLYVFEEPLLITRDKLNGEDFDLLFAFSLRQCALRDIFSFLNYHLHHNYQDNKNDFIQHLTIIKRTFDKDDLFTQELIDTVDDWISEQKSVQEKKTKIKTYLTVDALAYLFKSLTQAYLINDDNKAELIRFVCENFASKEQENISLNSFSSKFHSPTFEALEFWQAQFQNLSERAKKDKEQKLA